MESMLMDATSESETLPLPNTANISPISVTRCFQKLPSNHSSLEAMMLNSTYSCASSTRRADRLSPGFGIGPGQARAL